MFAETTPCQPAIIKFLLNTRLWLGCRRDARSVGAPEREGPGLRGGRRQTFSKLIPLSKTCLPLIAFKEKMYVGNCSVTGTAAQPRVLGFTLQAAVLNIVFLTVVLTIGIYKRSP